MYEKEPEAVVIGEKGIQSVFGEGGQILVVWMG